jgi:hypothetical protein
MKNEIATVQNVSEMLLPSFDAKKVWKVEAAWLPRFRK